MAQKIKFGDVDIQIPSINFKKFGGLIPLLVILFLVFVAMSLAGGWLVLKRTGNYDVDFFTKILGWILLIPGILGLLESLIILN